MVESGNETTQLPPPSPNKNHQLTTYRYSRGISWQTLHEGDIVTISQIIFAQDNRGNLQKKHTITYYNDHQQDPHSVVTAKHCRVFPTQPETNHTPDNRAQGHASLALLATVLTHERVSPWQLSERYSGHEISRDRTSHANGRPDPTYPRGRV